MTKFTHHHLSAERIEDEHGPAIVLSQQEGIEDSNVIVIHPWQLRAMCEQFGIIASEDRVRQTIASLQRRMKGLLERIEDLADWMAQYSDHRHADLSYEMTQLRALRELTDEWCADFGSKEAAPTVEMDSTPECATAPAQATLL